MQLIKWTCGCSWHLQLWTSFIVGNFIHWKNGRIETIRYFWTVWTLESSNCIVYDNRRLSRTFRSSWSMIAIIFQSEIRSLFPKAITRTFSADPFSRLFRSFADFGPDKAEETACTFVVRLAFTVASASSFLVTPVIKPATNSLPCVLQSLTFLRSSSFLKLIS